MMVSAIADAVLKVNGCLVVSTTTFDTCSGNILVSCARALSPTILNLVDSFMVFKTEEYFTTAVLIPPHKPLSDEIGTTSADSVFAPGVSPSKRVKGCTKARDFSHLVCAPLRRDAATIFIALVIF